jgi:hypothetical protein
MKDEKSTRVTSEIKEQTGVDKLLVLKKYGQIIILPVNSYHNPDSQKYEHLPTENDFAASRKTMAERFIPGFEAYLLSEGKSAEEIARVMGLLFENQEYLGLTWHKMQVQIDRFDHRDGDFVHILGTRAKNPFYGSCSGGEIIQVVTNLDELCLT